MATRKALTTASTSITSCVMAPATGESSPIAARTMPPTLRAMPPTALWSAIDRMRRLMCRNSSTLCSELSRMTAPAASEVISLFWPKAMPDRGRRQGRSIVDAVPHEDRRRLFGFTADELQLLLRALAEIHMLDADLVGQVLDLGFPVAGDEHHLLEVMLGAQMPNEVNAFLPRFVAEPQRPRIAVVDDGDAFQPAARQAAAHRRSRAAAAAVSCGS